MTVSSLLSSFGDAARRGISRFRLAALVSGCGVPTSMLSATFPIASGSGLMATVMESSTTPCPDAPNASGVLSFVFLWRLAVDRCGLGFRDCGLVAWPGELGTEVGGEESGLDGSMADVAKKKRCCDILCISKEGE